MINLKARSPSYERMVTDWQTIRACHAGETTIKAATTLYLPYTSGMEADGVGTNDAGLKNYRRYLARAHYPELVREAAEAIIGLMHRKPATIQVPGEMEPLLENLTLYGESAQVLLRALNQEQLLTGRVGLLADVATGAAANALPHLVQYNAEHIANWDVSASPSGQDRLTFVVLDESGETLQQDFSWKRQDKYRLLLSGYHAALAGRASLNYATGTAVDRQDIDPGTMVEPSLGGVPLDFIPFTIIGSTDLVPEPDVPPLLRLARITLLIYRGEADYRQSLFMQGQETLVIVGGHDGDDEAQKIGAGAVLEVPIGGDAKYVGVSGNSLGEQRQALENDYRRAAAAGAELLEARGKAAESGDALRVRVAARTASLSTIAKTGAEGLQNALRQIAVWRGLDPLQVTVSPNLDFAETEFNAQDLTYFMEAKQTGFPISLRSAHDWARRRDITQLAFEDEIAQIKKENEDGTAEALRAPPSRLEEETLEEQTRAAKEASKTAAASAKAAASSVKTPAAPAGGSK